MKFVISISIFFLVPSLFCQTSSDALKKEQKKINKLCLTNIVWGKENGTSYTKISFKGSPKLEDLKKTTVGKTALKSLIEKVKKEYMKEGEVLFNKNLAV